MSGRFAGRVAVVTGGSTGIGFGTAERLALEGARVVLVARTEARLAQAAAAIERRLGLEAGAGRGPDQAGGHRPNGDLGGAAGGAKGGAGSGADGGADDGADDGAGSGAAGGAGSGVGERVLVVGADVSTEEGMDRVREVAGPVDLVAAFAGGGGEPVNVADLPLARWHEVLDANLTSAFLTISAFLPGMLERGRGSIVTMSSTAARGPTEASPAYAAAKAGVIALTRAVALQAAPYGVRVNGLAPGSVLNDRTASLPEEVRDRIASFHPLGRMGTPDDVAAAAAFLLSDDASWITGVTLDVAGGRVMT